MSTTDFLAWWGAVVATLVALWDVFKWWQSGSKLHVRALPNMRAYQEGRGTLPGEFILVKVVNRGNSKTTLTTIALVHYASKWKQLRRRTDFQALIPTPGHGHALPMVLDVGEEWAGTITRNPDIDRLARNGYLYCCAYETTKDRPARSRIILADPSED
jgi:hypothetical protein